MGERNLKISANSIRVLEMIAAGSAYDQILAAYPDLTYLDIFRAAQDSLDALALTDKQPAKTVEGIRRSYPRAYEKWSASEERQLRELIRAGFTVARISSRLQRQRSAIRSRILKLGFEGELNAKEREELIRISKLDPANADPSLDRGTANWKGRGQIE